MGSGAARRACRLHKCSQPTQVPLVHHLTLPATPAAAATADDDIYSSTWPTDKSPCLTCAARRQTTRGPQTRGRVRRPPRRGAASTAVCLTRALASPPTPELQGPRLQDGMGTDRCPGRWCAWRPCVLMGDASSTTPRSRLASRAST